MIVAIVILFILVIALGVELEETSLDLKALTEVYVKEIGELKGDQSILRKENAKEIDILEIMADNHTSLIDKIEFIKKLKEKEEEKHKAEMSELREQLTNTVKLIELQEEAIKDMNERLKKMNKIED